MRGAWCIAVLGAACAAPEVSSADPRVEIADLLAASAAAWNRGDLAAFMADYAADSTLTYVSGGRIMADWDTLRSRYAPRFAPGATRDSLAYEDFAVHPLTPDLAYATARFVLRRVDSVTSSGPFTLILQRRGARWVIVHDHTSPDPPR